MESATVRRLIFVAVSGAAPGKKFDPFAVNAIRKPEFMIDVDVHDLKVLASKDLPVETAWGKSANTDFLGWTIDATA